MVLLVLCVLVFGRIIFFIGSKVLVFFGIISETSLFNKDVDVDEDLGNYWN
jgi:hypothetical protein